VTGLTVALPVVWWSRQAIARPEEQVRCLVMWGATGLGGAYASAWCEDLDFLAGAGRLCSAAPLAGSGSFNAEKEIDLI